MLLHSDPAPANTGSPLVVAEGDSITSAEPSWLSMLTIAQPVARLNVAAAGNTLVDMASQAATEVDAHRSPGARRNVLLIWGGTNDFAQNADRVATVYPRYVAYCQARQAAGWDVLSFTMLPRTDQATQGHATEVESDRQSFNTSIRANWATFSSGLVDVAANTTIGDYGDQLNTTYYNADQVHLIDAGRALVATIVQPRLAALGIA